MSDKSTAKTMFASLCANYEGSKKVREAKATMLIHQYELSNMKDDESIEEMYSRFQTLVCGLQILKKSYVTSDHVSKILRCLPTRWRPKVTAIEEAKDLNTLSVEDFMSSLKVHEISLNEHDSVKKTKSIVLPSKGKSSKALKVIESGDESPYEDSDEDPAVVERMVMLSNKLQYLARKNKKFLSRRSGYKGSKKEDQKGCFNCKEPGHFIADCPDLQKENLNSKSRSDKEEAVDEENVVMVLVATVTSKVEPESDSEDENEVYSKIPREELIESLKKLLTHSEHKTNELNDLKDN